MARHRNLIAILRGLTPAEAAGAMGEALIEAGITRHRSAAELAAPDDLDPEAGAHALAGFAQIGAGTVLTPRDVDEVAQRRRHASSSRPTWTRRSSPPRKAHGMESWPGAMTPTEAFAALKAGRRRAEAVPGKPVGPDGACRRCAPSCRHGTQVYAVGGAGPSNFAEWLKAGADGFGIGTALFTPGHDRGRTSPPAPPRSSRPMTRHWQRRRHERNV